MSAFPVRVDPNATRHVKEWQAVAERAWNLLDTIGWWDRTDLGDVYWSVSPRIYDLIRFIGPSNGLQFLRPTADAPTLIILLFGIGIAQSHEVRDIALVVPAEEST